MSKVKVSKTCGRASPGSHNISDSTTKVYFGLLPRYLIQAMFPVSNKRAHSKQDHAMRKTPYPGGSKVTCKTLLKFLLRKASSKKSNRSTKRNLPSRNLPSESTEDTAEPHLCRTTLPAPKPEDDINSKIEVSYNT
jgi:hypothetical protein